MLISNVTLPRQTHSVPARRPAVSREPQRAVAPRAVFACGLGRGESARIRSSLEGISVDVVELDDYGSVYDALDEGSPSCLLLDPNSLFGRELCLDATLAGRGRDFPIVGVVSDPASRQTLDAFALGVDDILPRYNLLCAAEKIHCILTAGGCSPEREVPRILLADPNRRRRIHLATHLRRTGLRVEFALDHHEVRYQAQTQLVIASARLPEVGALACLRQFRSDPGAAHIPWLFVGTTAEVGHLAPLLAREPHVACHRVDCDSTGLLAAVQSLMKIDRVRYRRSARIPFAAPVRFDAVATGLRTWGCAADLSMGGMFVRTLSAPPVGTSVRVTFALPKDVPISVDGVVVWRAGLADGMGHTAGFGVEFSDDLDDRVREALGEGYQRAVALAAAARMQDMLGACASWDGGSSED